MINKLISDNMKKQTILTIPVFILVLILGVSGFVFGTKNAKVRQYSIKLNTPEKSPSLPKASSKPVAPTVSVVVPVIAAPAKKVITVPSKVNSTATAVKTPTPKPVVTPVPVVTTPVVQTAPTPTTSASPTKP